MKSFKIVSLFIFLFFITPTIIICQEDPQQFNDEIVTINYNFSERYPELAQGFDLLGMNFQNSMIHSLLGHYPYEKISLPNGEEISRLDQSIQFCEKELSLYLKFPFCRLILFAIRDDIKLGDITEPLFTYALSSPIIEQSIPLYINNFQLPNDDEDNLLIAATIKNNPEMVQFLLELGANSNRTSRDDRQSALHLAIKNNFFNIVTILLHTENIDINQKDRYGETALHIAVIYRRNKILNLLLKNSTTEIDPIDEHYITPLGYAIDLENLSMVKQLINAGANINFQGLNNWSPLHQAVDKNDLAITQYLLDAGAQKDIYMDNHKTALDLAETTEMRNLFRTKRKRAQEYTSNIS